MRPPQAARERSWNPVEPADARARHLSTRVAEGDPDALAELYEAWFDRMFAMARAISGRDEAFCLDVVQDAFLRVIRSIPRGIDEAQLAAWLRRVVHSAALDLLRRERRRSSRERAREDGRSSPAALEDGPELEERIRWLRAQLDAMPGSERALLGFRFRAGATFERAGGALGLTGDAACARIRRVLRRLKACAEETFDES